MNPFIKQKHHSLKYLYNHISWIYGYYYGLSFVVWGNIAVDGVEFLGWAQQQLLKGEDKRCSAAPWPGLAPPP